MSGRRAGVRTFLFLFLFLFRDVEAGILLSSSIRVAVFRDETDRKIIELFC